MAAWHKLSFSFVTLGQLSNHALPKQVYMMAKASKAGKVNREQCRPSNVNCATVSQATTASRLVVSHIELMLTNCCDNSRHQGGYWRTCLHIVNLMILPFPEIPTLLTIRYSIDSMRIGL